MSRSEEEQEDYYIENESSSNEFNFHQSNSFEDAMPAGRKRRRGPRRSKGNKMLHPFIFIFCIYVSYSYLQFYFDFFILSHYHVI